ncbi:hypothetical protein ACI65C_000807 [Semiaphis heraclei]
MHYRHRFSLLRAQVKLESRLAYESYLGKINTSLQNDPHKFWPFINNRRNTSGIPNVMHYGDIIASDVDIANLFALLFNSVYKSPLPPPHWNTENIGIKPFTFLPSRLTIELNEVEDNLLFLRTTKSRGPDVGLELAIHKCKVMSFSRRHSIIQYDYSINNVILQQINQVEDLGFIFTLTLSFAPHIDWIVGKALRSLGFIRRHAGLVMSILSCECTKWTFNEEIDKPSMNSICDQSHCNHKLYDHISHLVYASEKMLNALIRLIFDFENIKEEIEYLSKLPSNAERDSLLKDCKNFIFQEIKHFISSDSMVSTEESIEKPPFESPTIVDVLKNFCLYIFSRNIYQLKIAFKITKIILRHFDGWTWATPDKLPSSSRLKFNNSYKFYYQRYQEHCLTPSSNRPIIKPSYTSSKIFGKDILKYTLRVFRTSLTDWCLNESKNCTFSKKCLFMKFMPIFMDLLEQEVYAIDSPIWNPNFANTSFPKKVLDNLNFKLNELTQNQCYTYIMNSNVRGRINNNSLNEEKIPGVKYGGMFKDYVATENIFDTFECLNLDFGANISLKGFITDKIKPRAKGKHKGTEMIVFDRLSNFTKCVLCRKQLRNMYQTRLPRLPDAYISRLETEEQIKTLAILEDGIPIGGIYFRTFNSQEFTEIVLCIFKVDLHVNEYESCLMNYLKDLHIKQNIWDLLVYADKEQFAYFKNQNFSTKVKISKAKYNKYIVHYEDSKLMHCNLKK